LMKTIYFPGNPLWYRGYLMKTRSYSLINNEELNKVMQYYNIRQIFFGHTEVESIRFLYDNRVAAINVPMGYDDITPQVLMIDDGKYYRCYIDGTKELVK